MQHRTAATPTSVCLLLSVFHVGS